jgi:hypothetical protein
MESVNGEALTSYDHQQGGTMGLPAGVYIDVRQRDGACKRLIPLLLWSALGSVM